jgi:uncharacterized membrane protein YhiD involved in acid resistance
VVIDPTRMAQGIMTGIGFLGAGVIVKEGLTVRGLTTAASIWVTAAIGILTGIGFYYAAGLGVVLTLLFRQYRFRLHLSPPFGADHLPHPRLQRSQTGDRHHRPLPHLG